jgi:uncharacterized tellurite resistance protein B-like protein
MFKNLFKKKLPTELLNIKELDILLKLMFEMAISDGNLDKTELEIIKQRAAIIAGENDNVSEVIKNIAEESKESISFYPTIKIINETYSNDQKKELLKNLWQLVEADSVIDPYEENLYFKIAELIKIKRSTANKIRVQPS